MQRNFNIKTSFSLQEKLSSWKESQLNALDLEEFSPNESYFLMGGSLGTFLNDHWKTFLNDHPYLYTGLVIAFTGVACFMRNRFLERHNHLEDGVSGRQHNEPFVEKQNPQRDQFLADQFVHERKDQATCACQGAPITEIINKLNGWEEKLKRMDGYKLQNNQLEGELADLQKKINLQRNEHQAEINKVTADYEFEKQANGNLKQTLEDCINTNHKLSNDISSASKQEENLGERYNFITTLLNTSIQNKKPIQGPELELQEETLYPGFPMERYTGDSVLPKEEQAYYQSFGLGEPQQQEIHFDENSPNYPTYIKYQTLKTDVMNLLETVYKNAQKSESPVRELNKRLNTYKTELQGAENRYNQMLEEMNNTNMNR